MNCGSVDKLPERTFEAGRQYYLHVDKVVVRLPIRAHDNTLFHTLLGLRVGMQLRMDEQALGSNCMCMLRAR